MGEANYPLNFNQYPLLNLAIVVLERERHSQLRGIYYAQASFLSELTCL
jgi:hypothetical protein